MPISEKIDIQAILAYEYGYLDAKHHMDYAPPYQYETEYKEGRESFQPYIQKEEIPVGSYSHKDNWGWY